MARVHRRNVAEALDRPLVRAALQLLRRPGPLRTGVADQLPALERAVAAVGRVGERALVRIVLEHREEAEGTRCRRGEEWLDPFRLLDRGRRGVTWLGGRI